MGAARFQGQETSGRHKILCLLDALRQSTGGAVLYREVERMLGDLLRDRHDIEQAYLVLIGQLLEAYAGHLRAGSPLYLELKLLQLRLQPPVSAADMATLSEYVERYAVQIASADQMDSAAFQRAVEPLLTAFGIVQEAGQTAAERLDEQAGAPVEAEPAAPSQPPSAVTAAETSPPAKAVPGDEAAPVTDSASATDAAAAAVVDSARAMETPAGDAGAPAHDEAGAVAELADGTPAAGDSGSEAGLEVAQTGQPPEPAGAVAGLGTGTPIQAEPGEEEEEILARLSGAGDEQGHRGQLDFRRRDILKLQSTLAEQVLGTIAQNEEFGVLLEVVLGELRQVRNGKELEELRWTLIREIEKLTRGHHQLAEQLDNTHHYLQLIESDSRQMSDELTRVRLLSLTDELTGLPNRRAFLRRIEDEVARVQRYGFPLSFALIDLDHFKQVNDKYGHAGGDEVLQMYSKNILSIFRHHDLVARYGGEEFAVLLPNTDAEGAVRALTKVSNRARETRWQSNGDMIPVPTFSSGISLYKPGETASAFIERADKALYRAKRLGRNRVELDATYQSEPDTEPQLRDESRRSS
ncbi:MAG: diguanylate cyclase [Gammaproteobacteria bacterium]|jgi:diguanylate cyclase (GGDEF)-like protein